MDFLRKLFPLPRIIGLIVVAILAAIFCWFSRLPYWVCFLMIAAAMVLNGILAEWEDRQPGGFYNPKPPKSPPPPPD